MEKPEITVQKQVVGFRSNEVLNIKANSLKEAFTILGRRHAKETKSSLKSQLRGLGAREKKEKYLELTKDLKRLKKLSRTKILTVGGTNYLKRFLEAFEATCDGVGISYLDGAFLQSEAESGCQTIIVQGKKDKAVRLVHAEEDSSYNRFKGQPYKYRLVQMDIKGQKTSFFCYPDIFGWGYAVGINERAGLVQVADDLIPKAEYNEGLLWSSAVSFMCLDSGEKELVIKLMDRIKKLVGRVRLNGGYSIHFAWAGKPEFRSYEFIYDKVRVLPSHKAFDRSVIGQSNAAILEANKPYTIAAIPAKNKHWDLGSAQFYVEMKRRGERLLKLGTKASWLGKNAQESIREGLKILAYPEMDIIRNLDERKDKQLYFTGLPSAWTVAHMVAYLDKNGLSYYLGKFTPKPVKGSKYSMKYYKNYRFTGRNLWMEAKKEYARYKKS